MEEFKRMSPPTLGCARAVRDGGIDAMAALDSALHGALAGLPADQASQLKRVFGQVMGEIIFALINPAVAAFPELKPDNATWAEIARTRAAIRSGARP